MVSDSSNYYKVIGEVCLDFSCEKSIINICIEPRKAYDLYCLNKTFSDSVIRGICQNKLRSQKKISLLIK